ncbi:hypothetical protein KBD49_06300 [Myxococcota bacterium]|nr:hypothetical protein [Myxococcota bacterium]
MRTGKGAVSIGMLVVMGAVAWQCETEGRRKVFGAVCADGAECESNECWEGRCVSRGKACATMAECDDGQECSLDECGGDGRCWYRVNLALPSCVPLGTATCACGESGVRVLSNGCTWPDATECSGWHSVVMAQQREGEERFQDGTTLCMEDCCLTIQCP